MIKKSIVFLLTLGALFLLSVPTASASFTINGQPAPYNTADAVRVAVNQPVTVTSDDGQSYGWDFEYYQHAPDVVQQASGSSATWSYGTEGFNRIAQIQQGTVVSTGEVNVVSPEDAIPEDIELISSPSGPVPLEIRLRTTRRNLQAFCSGGCDGDYLGRTGPDGQGRYVHTYVLTKAAPELTLTVDAWNDEQADSIRDEFTLTVTGTKSPFMSARWSVSERGSRCVLRFRQGFEAIGSYKVTLRLSAKAGGMRQKESFRRKGSGQGKAKGKIVLNDRFLGRFPGSARAKVKLQFGGKTYRSKNPRELKTCA